MLFWLKFKIKVATVTFHSSELIFQAIKSRSEMSWAHACMGDMRNAHKRLVEKL
jgi:hypothetical protein